MLLKTNTVSFTTNMILINRKIPLLDLIGFLDIGNFSSILLRGIVIGNMTQVNPSEPKWTQVKPQQQQTGSNWSKLVQTGHYGFNQTGSNWSKRVKTGPNCLIWSNIAHNGSKWRKKKFKWSNMVKIHQKFLLKATAVGSTAVRNNLKLWTIINIASTIVLWWSLF